MSDDRRVGTTTVHPEAGASGPVSAVQSRSAVWTGRACSGLAVLFLLFDAGLKVVAATPAIEGTTALGYASSIVVPLGALELALLAVYLLPHTTVLGAVLWTGYLGGALASQLRVHNPWPTHVLFPVYVAALLWLGLWLRDRQLRAVVPLRARMNGR